ncbi:hypothetical protein HanPI659440_Chr03g0124281 [Helianthus annuus]|nr:hypothetical protein HanPI659440_Chr03g0124281 [Helianthus annuus]
MDRVGLDNSFQFIGVLVNHGYRIQDEAFLCWRGKTVKVWVIEDSNDWLEEFVYDSVGQNGDGNMEEELIKTPENTSSGDRPEVTPGNVFNAQEVNKENSGININYDGISEVGLELPFLNKEGIVNEVIAEEFQEKNLEWAVNVLKRKKFKKTF